MQLKFVNYRCFQCNIEFEIDYDANTEDKPDDEIVCKNCGNMATKYNFKNNSQQWGYMDSRGK